MFKESIGDIESHKKMYEKSDNFINVEYLQSICTTTETEELLNNILESCKEYYESLVILQDYTGSDDNKFAPGYNEKVDELALKQSDIHTTLQEKFENLADKLSDDKFKTLASDRSAIGRFAIIVGEMKT